MDEARNTSRASFPIVVNAKFIAPVILVALCAGLPATARMREADAAPVRHRLEAPLHAKRNAFLTRPLVVQTTKVHINFLASPPFIRAFPAAKASNPGYLNYDFRASPRDVHASFDYGLRLGSGIAQFSTLARAVGESRGIMLSGLAWQRHSDSGNTLIVGDSESRRAQYEDAVRFDGIQYSSPDFAYDVGWLRTDFGNGEMRFGSFVAQATATKHVSERLQLDAHLFTGSGTALAGLDADWTSPHAGDVLLGLAPAGGHGLTGFFGYTAHSGPLKFTLDDRIWSAQGAQPAELEAPNSRQLHAALEYHLSFAASVRAVYGSQSQAGFSARTLTVGFIRRVGDAEAHLDFAAANSNHAHNAGFTTYLSVPMGGGRTFQEQSSLAGGVPASTVTLKQDLPQSGNGSAYALKFDNGGTTSLTDAMFRSQTGGSSTQVEILRSGPRLDWNSEFTGSLVFFGGKAVGINQIIDQSGAFDALKGRTAAKVRIVTETGKALPAGALVRALYELGQWRLGSDGYVELDNLEPGPQSFVVTTASGTCLVTTIVPPPVGGEPDIGTQVCR